MARIHLIVAHPNPTSLNHAMANRAIALLSKEHSVCVSNLYAMAKEQHPAVMPFGTQRTLQEQKRIQQEQQKIQNSDLVLLQFPLYWFSLPGLLKTYWEQTLEPGFAYPGKFNQSPLNQGRKILFSITTQSNEHDYSPAGCNGPIDAILHHLYVAFRFVGFTILQPHLLFDAHTNEPNLISSQLIHYENQLKNLNAIPVLFTP